MSMNMITNKMVVQFEVYNGPEFMWHDLTIVATEIRYDRDDQQLLSLKSQGVWLHYNPVRDIRVFDRTGDGK